MTLPYSHITRELSPWKRFILAARECRDKGNDQGALALYKRALNCAKQAGVEYSEELISFLAKELWSPERYVGEQVSTFSSHSAHALLASAISV